MLRKYTADPVPLSFLVARDERVYGQLMDSCGIRNPHQVYRGLGIRFLQFENHTEGRRGSWSSRKGVALPQSVVEQCHFKSIVEWKNEKWFVSYRGPNGNTTLHHCIDLIPARCVAIDR